MADDSESNRPSFSTFWRKSKEALGGKKIRFVESKPGTLSTGASGECGHFCLSFFRPFPFQVSELFSGRVHRGPNQVYGLFLAGGLSNGLATARCGDQDLSIGQKDAIGAFVVGRRLGLGNGTD